MSHPGGRPPHFESPEALELCIESFFLACKETQDPVTITGLALFLGFESRNSLYDYEKRDEFSGIVKKARLRVENEYEKKLHSYNVTGIIFALKNMGWADRQEIKHEGIAIPFFNLDPLTDDPANHGTAEDSKP